MSTSLILNSDMFISPVVKKQDLIHVGEYKIANFKVELPPVKGNKKISHLPAKWVTKNSPQVPNSGIYSRELIPQISQPLMRIPQETVVFDDTPFNFTPNEKMESSCFKNISGLQ